LDEKGKNKETYKRKTPERKLIDPIDAGPHFFSVPMKKVKMKVPTRIPRPVPAKYPRTVLRETHPEVHRSEGKIDQAVE